MLLLLKIKKLEILFDLEVDKMPSLKEKETMGSYAKFKFNQGKNEEKKEIATNMLKMHLDVKIVSQATGLTISQLEALKKNLK
jgi:predicted transposase/invertase (TIGR01784 family)